MVLKISSSDDAFTFFASLVFAQGQRAGNCVDKVLALRERLGVGSTRSLRQVDVGVLAAAVAQRPALHRFPRRTAQTLIRLIASLADTYHDDPRDLWRDAESAEQVLERLLRLPGFGRHMSETAMYLLATEHAVDFGDDAYDPARIADWCPRLAGQSSAVAFEPQVRQPRRRGTR